MNEIMDRYGQTPEEFFAERAQQVYFPNARFDDRYMWEEILPRQSDGMPRYRLVGCAHRAHGPDGACFTCGDREKAVSG
jgi:hypothetical protein